MWQSIVSFFPKFKSFGLLLLSMLLILSQSMKAKKRKEKISSKENQKEEISQEKKGSLPVSLHFEISPSFLFQNSLKTGFLTNFGFHISPNSKWSFGYQQKHLLQSLTKFYEDRSVSQTFDEYNLSALLTLMENTKLSLLGKAELGIQSKKDWSLQDKTFLTTKIYPSFTIGGKANRPFNENIKAISSLNLSLSSLFYVSWSLGFEFLL